MSKKEQTKSEFPTEEELRSSTSKALKLICNKYGIIASGNKEAIINRLVKHFKDEERFFDPDVARMICGNGWAEDISGNIPTGERKVDKVVLAPQNVIHKLDGVA